MSHARHNPRCGVCGAPTRPREIVAGVQGWVCVSCGAATLDSRAVDQLTGVMPQGAQPAPLSASVPSRQPTAPIAHLPTAPPRRPPPPTAAPAADNISDSRFEAELLAMQIRRERRLTMLLGMVTVVVVVVLAIPLSFVVYQSVKSTTSPSAAAAPAPMLPRDPAPVPTVPAPPATPEATDAEAADDLTAAAAPQPDAAEPPPTPQPPEAGAPDSTSELVDKGWAVVDRSPATAARYFLDALDREPRHADASYGLGYAFLRQSRPEAAAPHLCNALRGGDTEIRRDVQSLLRTNQLECSP